MKKNLIISAMGQDRTGIINDLSDLIYKHQANIDDSRMSVLAGEFAIIVQVSGEESQLQLLTQDLPEAMNSFQLQYISKFSETIYADDEAIPYQIKVLSIDHPGIVHQVTDFLRKKSINIINLQTESYAAAHTGTAMFSLQMNISIPLSMTIAKIKEEMYDLADTLNLDISIEAIK